MIGERVALLVGLLGIPLLILAGGHRFRDQTPFRRRLFWGAILGHSAGMILCVAATLFPPIWWHDGPFWRDFLVHWSLLTGTGIGALAAVLTGNRRG